jgi:hypothetical protein
MSFWTIMGFAALAAAIAALANRDKIEARLRQFDESNLNKTRRLIAAKRNPNAHMMLTVEEVAEHVEPIETVWAKDETYGTLSKRFLWRGETYFSEEEAIAARNAVILHEARDFYVDLDRRRLGR